MTEKFIKPLGPRPRSPSYVEFSWNNITIGPNENSRYRVIKQLLKTDNNLFYLASHPHHGEVVIKQYQRKYIISDLRYLFAFNGMKHSLKVYDAWNVNIAMEKIEGTLDMLDISKEIYNCFSQLLTAVRDIHDKKIALFNIKPKNIGWVINSFGEHLYKFFDYDKALSFSVALIEGKNPLDDIVALGQIFITSDSDFMRKIAIECLSGQFTAIQLYKKWVDDNKIEK